MLQRNPNRNRRLYSEFRLLSTQSQTSYPSRPSHENLSEPLDTDIENNHRLVFQNWKKKKTYRLSFHMFGPEPFDTYMVTMPFRGCRYGPCIRP